jgi:hypothetical protein
VNLNPKSAMMNLTLAGPGDAYMHTCMPGLSLIVEVPIDDLSIRRCFLTATMILQSLQLCNSEGVYKAKPRLFPPKMFMSRTQRYHR